MNIPHTRWFFIVLSMLAGLVSSHAQAEQKATLGPWDVHYMVINTTFLTPEVAQRYDLVRSKYSALVNITVLDKESGMPQTVSVSGTATNLLGTKHSLKFKKVEESPAVYYLAPLSFNNQETFRFAIDIQHGDTQQTLRFKQQLLVE